MQPEPIFKFGGSAFVGNTTNAHHPIPRIKRQTHLNVVSLKEWCEGNFISRDTGYRLIKLKFLIAFRRYGQWWVTANPDCIEQLQEYLGVEQLLFDVAQ